MKARLRAALGWVAVVTTSLGIASAVVAGWGLLAYGSIHALPALARGKVVLVSPSSRSLETMQVGQGDEAVFVVTNLSSEPIVINGVGMDCTCVSNDALPLRLPPRGRRPLHFTVRPNATQAGKPFSQTVRPHLSVPGPAVSLTVPGTVASQPDDLGHVAPVVDSRSRNASRSIVQLFQGASR